MEKSINSRWTCNKFLHVLFSQHFLCPQYLMWERGSTMMIMLGMCRCRVGICTSGRLAHFLTIMSMQLVQELEWCITSKFLTHNRGFSWYPRAEDLGRLKIPDFAIAISLCSFLQNRIICLG